MRSAPDVTITFASWQGAVNEAMRGGQQAFEGAASALQDTMAQAQRQAEKYAPNAMHAARQTMDQASSSTRGALPLCPCLTLTGVI